MAPSKYAKPESIDPGPWTPKTAETINKLFESIYNATRRAGGSAFANQLDILDPAAGDLIVGQSGGIFGLVPYLSLSNLPPFSATQLLWGRNSAGAGVAQEVSLTQLLDWIVSPTWGDILFRGQTVWKRLPAGVFGQFLGTNGAVADPQWNTPTGGASPIGQKNHFEMWATNNGVAKSSGAGVDGAYTGTNNIPAAAFADGFFWQMVPAIINTSASLVGNTTNGGQINLTWDFDVSFIVRTDSALTTTMRYWVGITTGSPGNSDTMPANGAMFRYSTTAGDGGWVGVTFDGTQAVTATVAAIAANTRYTLRIRKVGATVFFSVNGGTETSTVSHVPTNDVYRTIVLVVTTLAPGAPVARSLYWSRLWADYAS